MQTFLSDDGANSAGEGARKGAHQGLDTHRACCGVSFYRDPYSTLSSAHLPQDVPHRHKNGFHTRFSTFCIAGLASFRSENRVLVELPSLKQQRVRV